VEAGLLARIAAEAHRQGLAVWSHAAMAGPAKPGHVVRSGVDVISHAEHLVFEAVPQTDSRPRLMAQRWMEDDLRSVPPDHPAIVSLLKLMKERGTILDATVDILRDMVATARRSAPSSCPLPRRGPPSPSP